MPTRIEYVDETINPLGHWCFGPGGTKDNPKPCPYCYARIMARRGITKCGKCRTFDTPHTHFEQLEKLAKWKTPRTIFVQSMGDLLHDEVPNEWIFEIFKTCCKTLRHRYLILTKNPKRYQEFLIAEEDIFWLGTTVTTQKMYDEWADLFEGNKYHHHYQNLFLSIEPIQEPIDCSAVKANWIIVGLETGNRKGKVIPKREWVEAIVNECRRTNTPVFMKDSLRDIWGEPLIREYPWEAKEWK
jgi:protein gp37